MTNFPAHDGIGRKDSGAANHGFSSPAEPSDRPRNGKPLVSVIIIFFNEERFLEEAIESVFDQKYDRWELLLVDDGSSDGSSKIARRYAESSPRRVRYLEHDGHQNRGMSASRNLGLCHAQGKYVAFLDADDVWFSMKTEEQVAILETNHDAAMVYGPLLWWYSWTGHPRDSGRDRAQDLGIDVNRLVPPPRLLHLCLSNEGETPLPSGMLIRRQALKDVGGFEERFHGMYEDQVLHVKLSLKASIYVSDRVWCKWRKHADSCCAVSVKTHQFQRARLVFLNWVEAYFYHEAVLDPALWKTLKRALRPYRHPAVWRLQQYAAHILMQSEELLKMVACHTVPVSTRRWLKAQWWGG